MKLKIFKFQIVLFFGLILSALTTYAGFAANSTQKIRLACVGNSVTYGYGIENRETNSYPAQLQKMLGDDYEIGNFGHNGATLLFNGHNPYIKTDEFQKALNFKPDILIIHLGLNDTDPRNWPNLRDEFISDYTQLIEAFVKSGTKKNNIWICKMTPVFNWHPRFKSGTRDWFWQIQDAVKQVSVNNHVGLIDLHSELYARPDLFKDALHPDSEGAEIIANAIAGAITGNYGGLQLSPVFDNHMVLQQNKEICIWGKANRNEKITVSFQAQNKSTNTDLNGNWQVKLDAVSSGGPFTLKVSGENNENIILSDILVGEVWLCSGQSNMEFPLKNDYDGKKELVDLNNENLRLLNYKGIKSTDAEKWDEVTLKKVNQLEYFSGKWERCTAENAAGFSAIAYYFAKALSDSLNVPVGIIQIAVGGAPIESFIDRKTIEFHPQLTDVLTQWKDNDFIMQWCRERAAQNLADATNPLQRHPFEPAYIFEAGISAFTKFAIQGVIWYQGESNAHNTEHFLIAFPEFVNSWRGAFGNPALPVYFAQISSIDRPSWPIFRDCQRQLALQTENSGMVVTSDLGDSLNVHPIFKKEIGLRFAKLALNKTYNFDLVCSGPVVNFAVQNKNQVEIYFKNAQQLKTLNNSVINELEAAGMDKIFKPVLGKIEGNKVIIQTNDNQLSQIRYGWKPFSRGNLINESGFPASTFKINIQKYIENGKN